MQDALRTQESTAAAVAEEVLVPETQPDSQPASTGAVVAQSSRMKRAPSPNFDSSQSDASQPATLFVPCSLGEETQPMSDSENVAPSYDPHGETLPLSPNGGHVVSTERKRGGRPKRSRNKKGFQPGNDSWANRGFGNDSISSSDEDSEPEVQAQPQHTKRLRNGTEWYEPPTTWQSKATGRRNSVGGGQWQSRTKRHFGALHFDFASQNGSLPGPRTKRRRISWKLRKNPT
eukprot:COSAG02_NODE_3265_length_7066_cov_7.546003_2_plen_232_part_00